MKKLAPLLLAAGLVLAAAPAAWPVDVTVSGQADFVAQWTRKGGNKADPYSFDSSARNSFYQLVRVWADITASESLHGVLGFEIGEITWGRSGGNLGPGSGGALGSRGVNVEVLDAYLDWTVPRTNLKIRMGMQPFANPTFVQTSSQVFSDQSAGVIANCAFTPAIGLSAWWFRPLAENSPAGAPPAGRTFADLDMLGLALPLSFDGAAVTPWIMGASIGRDSLTGYNGDTSVNYLRGMFPSWANEENVPFASRGQGLGWWAGLTGSITAADPFRFAWDFNYGVVDMGTLRGTNDKLRRAGWHAAALAEYKLESVTPGLIVWYGSGDGKNPRGGSRMLPMISSSSQMTTFGQDGSNFEMPATGLEAGLAGTWGLLAQLEDITFIHDVSHTLRLAWYNGTNHANNASPRGGRMDSPWMNTDADAAFLYLTDRDSAWEANFDTNCAIFENLTAGVELGYIRLNVNQGVWGKKVKRQSDNMYKIAVGLSYTF